MSAGVPPPGSRDIEPEIRTLAARLTRYAETDRDRALGIYRFVRDEIQFGFTKEFYALAPSQTIAAGVGFCMTKGLLFVQLLEAAGVPARLHFVDIRSSILDGLLKPGTPYIDHCFSEVLLDARWVGVDSYVIDAHLFEAAHRRLREGGHHLGFGVHHAGLDYWDGERPSFVQWVNDGTVPDLTTRDFGYFSDPVSFYELADRPWTRKYFGFEFLFGATARAANRRAAVLRRTVTASPTSER